MTLAEQILDLENELEEFKSGKKYNDLEEKITSLEFDKEDLEETLKEYEECICTIVSMLNRL